MKRLVLTAVVLLLAGCGSDGDRVQVVVSAPVSTEPWIAGSIERGARLAVDEINDNGGVLIGEGSKQLELVVLDNASSPATAQANAREAISRKAAVLLTDGTGATSVAAVTNPAKLPVFVLFEGGDTTGKVLWQLTLERDLELGNGRSQPPAPSQELIPKSVRLFAREALDKLPLRDPVAAHP